LSNSSSTHNGWLCPTDHHRERMLDMGPRVHRARLIAMGAMGAGMLAVSPRIGWPMVPVFAAAAVAIATLDMRVGRAKRPEGVIARTIMLMTVLTAISASLTGGATSPVLPLLAVTVAVSAARFRAVVVWASAGFASAAALVVALIDGPAEALDDPLMLVSTLVLLVAVTAATTALMDAEFEFRSQSVLDPLTGLLNRAGLEARFAEVAEQAKLLDQPVCMVVCDLDHFKAVNDSWGHERGDTVLREVTYEMRKSLRSFELFYRIGGEEFLILLPGVDLPAGIALAENLRDAAERCRPGGLVITASFGVSVATGEYIDFLPMYRAADESLYVSKDAGRNRVSAVGVHSAPAPEAGAVPAV
jgi:diguanylate cyclase (GGDEF)-like protein